MRQIEKIIKMNIAKNKTKKILLVIFACLTMVVISMGILSVREQTVLKQKEDVMQAAIIRNSSNDDSVSWGNELQIITVDSLFIKGESLENTKLWEHEIARPIREVAKTSPFFITTSTDGEYVSLYNTYGLVKEINLKDNVLLADVSSKGDVYIIQDNGKSFALTLHRNKGDSPEVLLELEKQDYWPTAIKTHPKRDVVLVSWINTAGPVVKSYIIVCDLREGFQVSEVFIERDNIIYELSFVDDDRWIGIGDKNKIEKELK